MVYAVVFAFLSFSFTEEDAIGVFRGGYDMGSALLAFDLLHLRQLQLFLWSDPSGPGVLEWIFYFLRGNNFLVCLKKNTRLMICGQR